MLLLVLCWPTEPVKRLAANIAHATVATGIRSKPEHDQARATKQAGAPLPSRAFLRSALNHFDDPSALPFRP